MRIKLAQLTKSKRALAVLVTAVLVALVGTTVGYAAMNKTVTLSVDGTATQVHTTGDTVAEVLDSQGITVGSHDIVAPGLDSPVDDDSRIAVRYGRQLQLDVDGKKTTYWVTANSVGNALEQIGVRYANADLSASRGFFLGRDGLTLSVTTPKKVRLKVANHKLDKVTSPSSTVRDLLRDLHVRFDKNDEVTPRPRHELQDGDKVVVTRVRVVSKRFRHEAVSKDVVKHYSGSLAAGTTRTVRSGHDGSRDVTYRLRFENGHLVARKVIRATMLDNPVSQILRIGTREAAPATNFASGGTVWDQLAQCESGGNWATDTGNGYYGGLQFDLSTWQSYGGSGYPDEASRETQIGIATKVRDASGGYGAWPACASSLGLPT